MPIEIQRDWFGDIAKELSKVGADKKNNATSLTLKMNV
jgi:hypothetical protein